MTECKILFYFIQPVFLVLFLPLLLKTCLITLVENAHIVLNGLNTKYTSTLRCHSQWTFWSVSEWVNKWFLKTECSLSQWLIHTVHLQMDLVTSVMSPGVTIFLLSGTLLQSHINISKQLGIAPTELRVCITDTKRKNYVYFVSWHLVDVSLPIYPQTFERLALLLQDLHFCFFFAVNYNV